jgi:hypothetical protein
MKNIALMLTAVLALALTAGCKEKAAAPAETTEVGAAVDNAVEEASEAAAAAGEAAAVAAEEAAQAAGEAAEAAGQAAESAADAAAEAMTPPAAEEAPAQ